MRYVFYGVLVALLTMSNAQAGQIYQCGDTFQDRPCAGDKSKLVGQFQKNEMSSAEQKAKQKELAMLQAQTVADAEARYNAEVAAATKARAKTYKYANGLKAVNNHQIAMGLSHSDVIRAWGQPYSKNETVTNTGGSSEQWVYVNGDGSRQYIYFTSGEVTGWN